MGKEVDIHVPWIGGSKYHEYIDPPTHGILTTLPMVYRPPYLWYFDPPIHVISTPYPWHFDPPLPMVF
jgi:hypothetical protein